MGWVERLNRGPARIALGQGTAEVLHWAHQDPLPDNAPHRHTFFEVCQVGAHGQGEFRAGGHAHPLAPGTIFFARPGVVHQIVNTQAPEMELFWVCFQWTPGGGGGTDEVSGLLRAFAESPVAAAPDEAGRLASLWAALRAWGEAGPRLGYEAQASALIAGLLLTIAQTGAGQAAGEAELPAEPEVGARAARLAVRYVHDNLSRPLSVAEIAAQVYVSPRQVSRLFAQFTGTSPAAYVVRARMDLAAGLLAHTELPIKEIAESVGYPDVHHFTRAFAAQTGCPPGKYRRDPGARPVPNIQTPGALV